MTNVAESSCCHPHIFHLPPLSPLPSYPSNACHARVRFDTNSSVGSARNPDLRMGIVRTEED